MSFCINSGSTFFGLVKQDYTLPDEVLLRLGFDLAELETCELETCELETCALETCELETCELEAVFMLRRGVIGFHRIGYI